MEFQLGRLYKDSITGFVGCAIGLARYLTGCVQALIVPIELDEKGKRIEGEWVDVGRLTLVPGDPIVMNKTWAPTLSGPVENAPPTS